MDEFSFSIDELQALLEFVGIASSDDCDRSLTCSRHRSRAYGIDASSLKRKIKEEILRRRKDV